MQVTVDGMLIKVNAVHAMVAQTMAALQTLVEYNRPMQQMFQGYSQPSRPPSPEPAMFLSPTTPDHHQRWGSSQRYDQRFDHDPRDTRR